MLSARLAHICRAPQADQGFPSVGRRHATARAMVVLLDLPTNLLELIFEQSVNVKCNALPRAANVRIIKLLENCLKEHEREVARSTFTNDSDNEEDDEGIAAGRDREAHAAAACRRAIIQLNTHPVVIATGRHAVIYVPDVHSIPDARAKIDVLLKAPFVPRSLAWQLASACRTLRDIGFVLPLLQPLVFKMAREVAAARLAAWMERDDDEVDEEDEEGEWVPPRRLAGLRLLAAQEVRTRVAGRRLSRSQPDLRAFMEIADMKEHAASNEYKAIDHDNFRGEATLCYGLRLGYGTAVRLLAAGRRWVGGHYLDGRSVPLDEPAPSGGHTYVDLPNVAAVDAAVQCYHDAFAALDGSWMNTLDISYAALHNMRDLKMRAGQGAGLSANELAFRFPGTVNVFFTGYQDSAGPEVVLGIELGDLERFGFDLEQFGIEWGAGIDDKKSKGERWVGNDDIVDVSSQFVASVLGWLTESALFQSMEQEVHARVSQLLASVDMAARAELVANRHAAARIGDAWHNATTIATDVGWHVVFNQGC